jgi:chemotaxis protein MotB
MKENSWHIMIEGHADAGETGTNGKAMDAYELSSQRALAVSKSLIQRGISPERVTTIFYGDSRQQDKTNPEVNDRRVEFLLKKVDLRTEGRKVEAQ